MAHVVYCLTQKQAGLASILISLDVLEHGDHDGSKRSILEALSAPRGYAEDSTPREDAEDCGFVETETY